MVDEPPAHVRLRTGAELVVIDLSSSGVLVEGSVRLLPGTHLDAHMVTRDGRVPIRCRVVRAFVCHLEADVVRYRGALAFEGAIDMSLSGYHVPSAISGLPSGLGTGYPIPESPSRRASRGRIPA